MDVPNRAAQPTGWNPWASPRVETFLVAIGGLMLPGQTAFGADVAVPDASKHLTQLDLVSMLFVFMLSTIIGMGVIRRVSRLLHTPLMSLTNAISAISVVGAIMVAGGEHYPTPIRVCGSIALFASMTNIVSGFLITDRMLKMFKKRKEEKVNAVAPKAHLPAAGREQK